MYEEQKSIVGAFVNEELIEFRVLLFETSKRLVVSNAPLFILPTTGQPG